MATRDRRAWCGEKTAAARTTASLGLAATVGLLTCSALSLVALRAEYPWTLRADNTRYEFPLTLEAYRAWSRGHVPQWTDKIWAGYPLLADPTTKALYAPAYLPFLVTAEPHLRAYDLLAAMHAGLLAAGSVYLLGLLGASPVVSVLGGILTCITPELPVFAVSFLAVFCAVAWWPLTFVGAERLAHAPPDRVVGAAAIGWVALAAQILAGYPEFALYSGVVAVAWLVTRRTDVRLRSRLGRAALLVGGALALAAPQLIPTLRHLPQSGRSEMPIAPDLFSKRLDSVSLLLPRVPWATGDQAFVGLATLALVAIALFRRRPRAGFLAVVGILGVLLSTGSATPLWPALHALPGFALFRNPFKFFVLAELALAWAATLALADLGARRMRAVVPGLALLAVLEHLAYATKWVPATVPPPREMNVSAALAALKAADPTHDALPGHPPPRTLERIEGQLGPFGGCLGMVWGIAQLTGGAPPLLGLRHLPVLVFVKPTAARLDLFGVDFVLSAGPDCRPMADRLGVRLRTERPAVCVLENPRHPPRYEVLSRVLAVGSVDAMVAAVLADPAGPVPVVVPGGGDIVPPDVADGGEVGVESYAPGEVRLDVASAGARLLLVRESWDAGWEARVDGERTPLYEAAGIFFAVPVPPGRHRVALSYRTPGFRIGLLVTGLWLAGSAIHGATRL